MFVHNEPDPKTWKELLTSQNNPLFKRIKHKSPIIGPHTTKEGKVVGDLLAMENNHFETYATEEQKQYYNELLKINKPRAYEYLLTITNSIDIWKQDLQAIWYVRALLTTEADSFKQRLRQLKESLKEEQIKEIPNSLKRHIPEQIFDIEIEEIIKIAKIEEKEKALTEYLKKIGEQMPFLFEDMRYI
ncbi:transposase [Candidatus Woesearchaeota archaeon]|nr:transposase [Candidatus Woesearchaeota archaeon]